MISDERLRFKLKTPTLCTTDEIEMAKELLALRQRREIPEGWKLVPIEPTEEMLRAWRGDMYKSYAKIHIEHIGDDEIVFAYSAMIAAAPTPS